MNTVPMNIAHEGPPPKEWQVHIDHLFTDGIHVLTCDQVDGFFVTSIDPDVLWDRAIFTMECLLKENENLDCKVTIPPEFTRIKGGLSPKLASKPPIKNVTAIITQKAA